MCCLNETDTIIKFIGTSPAKFKRSTVVVGVPDVGLVASIATSHLIDSVGLKEVGFFESDYLPPVMLVHEGEPKPPVRMWGKDSLIVVASEVPLSPEATYPLVKFIVSWTKTNGANMIIGLSGLPVPNRLEIENPAVYGLGTSSEAKELLKRGDVPPFQEGMIAGTHALLLKESIKQNVPNIILLAESHYQFPDPGASASVVKVLNRLLGLNIDVQSLLQRAEEIRIKTRELMRKTQQQMKTAERAQPQDVPGIYV